MDLTTRMVELARGGFACSQVMMQLVLEMDGRENPDLIRAMSGLCDGMGRTGGTCGCLTGGVCVIGYFTGKGVEEELEHSHAKEIVAEYANWFKDRFGATDCRDFIGGDYSKTLSVCAAMIEKCFDKLTELIEAYNLIGG